MKILCHCGHVIYDQTDDLPHKAYIRPDQSSEALYEAIDRLMRRPIPVDVLEQDAMWFPVAHPRGQRTAYQCPDCGRIYISDGQKLHCFKPEFDDTPKTLFRIDSPADAEK